MEISLHELINSNEFLIDTNVVQALKNEINKRLGNKEYISLTGIKNHRRSLPDMEFRWNPYIIKSILLTNGFKDVIRRNSDYRNECVIILKETSKINYFDELIYYLLRNEYTGNLHETAVYDYLVSLCLIKEGIKYNRRLPNELYNSDYMTIENTGRIKLNEVQICQISD